MDRSALCRPHDYDELSLSGFQSYVEEEVADCRQSRWTHSCANVGNGGRSVDLRVISRSFARDRSFGRQRTMQGTDYWSGSYEMSYVLDYCCLVPHFRRRSKLGDF
jgi:hypothetical protein